MTASASSDLGTAPRELDPRRDDAWRFTASRSVHPSNMRTDHSLLVAIAEGLGAVAVPGQLTADPAPDGRTYELLLETAEYDAWIIHWPAGTGLDTHDHGDSAGAFVVVDGALDEDLPGVDGTVHTRRVGAGGSVSFGVGYVHAVVNRTDHPATSVHVYSPPVRGMGFYRSDDGRLVLDHIES